jgi:carboxyl-terminal processing protease
MKRLKALATATLAGGLGLAMSSPILAADPGSGQSPARSVVSRLALQTWTDAFDSMHDELSSYYAFSEWKQIDWAAKYLEFQPRIANAEAINDSAEYFLALREYVYTIPDAHVRLVAIDPSAEALQENAQYEQIGGGYGFVLVDLDDGRFVAHTVTDESPAALAGMQPGAEIFEFNDGSIDAALRQAPLTWAIAPPATRVTRRFQQGRFLGRAPVGETMNLVFQNPGEMVPITAQLTAVHDSYESLLLTAPCADLPLDVYSEIINTEAGPVGYVRVTHTADDDDADLLMAQFAGAVQSFVDEEVLGVVVDLRTNPGGLDRVAALLPGHFYSEEAHYEYVSFYDAQTGQFEIDPQFTLSTLPQTPYFSGRVVAMTGICTASSGEGVAMAIQRLPRGEVVGFYGSYGSFGIAGGVIEMPGGFVVVYPPGRSLDENLEIQLDSDADLEGGVIPDVHVPLNDETIRNRFVDDIDVVLERSIDRIVNPIPPPRRPRARHRP